MNVPERLYTLVPGQAEHMGQETSLTGSFNLVFSVKAVNFLLENFAHWWLHIFNIVKLFLVFCLFAFFVVLKHFLVSMLK